MTAESARTASKRSSAILAPIGFPVIATSPMPFDFNSMRWLTSWWCYFVSMGSEKLNLLTPHRKPYGLSCLKWELALGAPLVACGSISPRAGPDTICWWRSGKNLNACPTLRPVRFPSPRYLAPPVHQNRPDLEVFLQNAFSPTAAPAKSATSLLWSSTSQKIHAMETRSEPMKFLQTNFKNHE